MIYLLTSILLFFGNPADGDWKTISEDARILSEQGYHAESGQSYEKAWLAAEHQTTLLIAAGEEYMQARMYNDAVRVFEEAMLDGSTANHLQYKLGMALKGNGRYEAAIAMLSESLQVDTRGSYILKDIIKNEIAGCEMALMPTFRDSNATVNRMNSEINSSASDYAAMAVKKSKLYFASAKNGSPQIYESSNLNGSWTTPSMSKELSAIIKGNYGGGTFNKDMSEFYFSVCDPKPTLSATGQNCKIHKSVITGRGWSQPEPMRDYMNWPGTTNAHPTIVYEGDTEVLYFASDRTGGQGGMDIWYSTRELNSSDLDFTFPVNAGPVINSIKDDVTPFYDRTDGTLYFSSNGHANAGGLDVFKITGKRNQWSSPENMNAPVNSSADDYYYAPQLGSEKAFLTSNRLVDGGQKTTSDDDIFEISFGEGEIVANTSTITSTGTVSTSSSTIGTSSSTTSRTSGAFNIKGRITDAMNGKMVDDTYVTLYKAVGETKRRKIETIKTSDGRYKFNMAPGEYYIVEAYKPGYKIGDFEFNTDDLGSGVEIDIPLDRAKGHSSTIAQSSGSTSGSSTASTSTIGTSSSSASRSSTNSPTTTYTPPTSTYTPSRSETLTPTTVSPSNSSSVATYVEGTEYRIQLTAVGNYNPQLPIFSNARKYGTLGTEMHPNGSLTRVFLRSFSSYSQAKSLIDTMKSYGFDTAFVVKYENGQRTTL